MFMQMLKDEFPDVRLHIISKLELVNKGKLNLRRPLLVSLCLCNFSDWHRIALQKFATSYRSAG